MKKILLILAIILALLGTFLTLNLKSRMGAQAQNGQTVLIEVPKGSSPSKVFQILKQNGIWSDDLAFRLTMKRLNPSLKAGWFEIPGGLTLPQVLDIIASGKVAVRRVTIPEGGPERGSLEQARPRPEVRPQSRSRGQLPGRLPAPRHLPLPD